MTYFIDNLGRVTVLLLDEIDSAVSVGWLRPVVLMPACLLSRMPLDLVEALLAHELAHIRRHDYLVNLLQGLVEASAGAHAVASARGEARTAEEPYALVRDGSDGMLLSGSTDDIDEIKAIRGGMSKDFIWFRRNGQAYTVTDPALLARAQRAWEHSQTVAQRMEGLSREMEAHRERMNRMGAEMGTLSAPMPPVDSDPDAQRRIGQRASRQGRLAAQHARLSLGLGGADDAQEAKLEAQMQGLEAQMEALEVEIEREADRIEAQAERVARNSAPIEALARRVEEAAKPMEALGRRMDALGKEHERHAARADTEPRAVIREAIDKGHARPARGVAPDR